MWGSREEQNSLRAFDAMHRSKLHRYYTPHIIRSFGSCSDNDAPFGDEPIAIDRFFSTNDIPGYARNEYVGCLKTFTRWAGPEFEPGESGRESWDQGKAHASLGPTAAT